MESNEFLESRIERYSHDRLRYPMYFKPKHVRRLLTVQPSVRKTSSATKALDTGLRNWARDPLNVEKQYIFRAKKTIISSLDSRQDRAITSSLFSPTLEKDNAAIRAVQREISSEYTKHYMEECNADILTGISGLQAYDDLSIHFPHYDVQLFQAFLRSIGLLPEGLALNKTIEAMSDNHGSEWHLLFVNEWSHVINWIKIQQDEVNSAASLAIQRSYFIAEIRRFISSIEPTKHNQFDLQYLSGVLRAIRKKFQIPAVMELPGRQQEEHSLRFLIMVATDLEQKILFEILRRKGLSVIERPEFKAPTWKIDTRNGIEQWIVRTEMGPLGHSGSAPVATESILRIDPTHVMMPGIAFGLKPKEQKLGDVVIARWVVDYESAKVTVQHQIPRIAIPEIDADTLSAIRGATQNWKQSECHVGQLLSGCKLVNSKPFIMQLRGRFPDAKGGEMEANGVVSASTRYKRSWMVAKAICDWGYGKKDNAQAIAAENAVNFTFEIISRIIAKETAL